MNNYRGILVSKIKFYEKMARKERKKAQRSWYGGDCKFGTYEASLGVADRYDKMVLALTGELRKYDEEKGLGI